MSVHSGFILFGNTFNGNETRNTEKSLRVASSGDPAYGRHITTEECSPC